MKSKSSVAFAACVALLIFSFIIAFSTPAQAQPANRQLTQSPTQQTQSSQRRVALVIGNGAYEHAGRLANPPNDATLVAATLRQLGFEVKNGSNLTQREMKQRIREFGQTLRTNGGVGLFYFAGHGVQAKGHNYLVPVDADIQTEADLEDVAVDLNYVLSLMDDAQNALNIVILDACRNNPFARSFRSAQEGLAQVKAPTGTLIAYATAPDSIAADGTGTNSPYSQELVKEMQASGVLVETMFRRVTEQVSARTNGKQEPWYSANVKGDFYFTGDAIGSTSNRAANSTTEASISRVDPTAFELSYWETIKSSNNPDDFKSYLDKYPEGQFAALAKNKIAVLNTSANPGINAGGDNAAELTFWDSIKNSSNPADFRAYLARYPNGIFSDLAKTRLVPFEAAEAEKATEETIKRQTKSYKATFGAKATIGGFSSPGMLKISPVKIEFVCDSDNNYYCPGGTKGFLMDCPIFSKAVIDGNAIREISIRSWKYRLTFSSTSQAETALREIQSFCSSANSPQPVSQPLQSDSKSDKKKPSVRSKPKPIEP